MKNYGFTLVELMISMVLGLLLSAGVLALYLNSQETYQSQKQLSDIQKNAENVADYLEKALNQAGYFGACDPSDVKMANVVRKKSGNTVLEFDFSNPIKGYDLSNLPSGYLANNFMSNSTMFEATFLNAHDSIVNRGHDRVVNHNFTIDYASTQYSAFSGQYSKGDVIAVMEPDCSYAGIFVQTAASTTKPNYSNGNTGSLLGNCFLNIKGDYDCNDTLTSGAYGNSSVDVYSNGSPLYGVSKMLYAIMPSPSDASVGSLYEINQLTNERRELVRGVLNVLFSYGISESASAYATPVPSVTPSPVVDLPETYQRVSRYMSASEIENSSGTTQVFWSDVIAVKAHITMQSSHAIADINKRVIRNYNYVFSIRNQILR